MTSQDQIKFIEQLDSKTLALIKSKSKDYADVDVLSNFKTMSELCRLIGVDTKTPEGCGIYMTLLKIVRIWNLKKDGKTPENESLLDSYEDGINYFKLALCCEVENIPPVKAIEKEELKMERHAPMFQKEIRENSREIKELDKILSSNPNRNSIDPSLHQID